MRKAIAGIIIGILLGACGTAVAKDNGPTGYFNEKTNDDLLSDIGWHVIATPEGKTIKCIWADNNWHGSGGISCNWQEYNSPK